MNYSTRFFRNYSTGEPKNKLIRVAENKYILLYGSFEDENGDTYNLRKNYDHRPSIDEIRTDIEELINKDVQDRILTGFTYDGSTVWLSMENQSNYMAAVLDTSNRDGDISVTIRTGSADAPAYKTFSSRAELMAFYTQVVAHIQSCLREGWAMKDSIDYSVFEEVGG